MSLLELILLGIKEISLNNNETQKENIAGLYHRIAPTYGHIGPDFFSYAGKHLVEHIRMTAGARVLDVAAGRGANLFPSLEQALSEFFRVLRPDGKVGITVAQDLDALSQWYGRHITEYHTRYQFPLRAGGGNGGNYSELSQYLTHTGFKHVEVLYEEADFVYADAQEWWNSRWSHGPRYALEHMTPEVLAQFKAEAFAKLAQEAQSNGIHETVRIQYVLADRGA